MKKTILLMMAIISLCLVCNNASAYTRETDPAAPLPSNYIGYGEWNTDGDLEDWSYNDQVSNVVVQGGNFDALSVNADPQMNLDVASLGSVDPRNGKITIAGTIIDIRAKFITNTASTRIDLFPTIDGIFQVPPITIADSIETNGEFHVYRVTLDSTDTNLLGTLEAMRFDPVSDVVATEAFEIDYLRIANMDVPPVPPAPSYTVELDPITPLDNYISIGDWNTDDDFENWTTHLVDNAAVYGGSITGMVVGNDMNISLDITTLSSNDVRGGNVMITGSVYEIRLRFDQYTETLRSEFFPTMDGIFKVPPVTFASNNDPALPDIEGDGLFHVYRITLISNFYLGKLDGIRFDALDDFGSNETFEVDYFRIANVITNVPYIDPITVDGELLSNYTSLAEWETDGDIENWQMINITNETVSGGVLSGEPLNGDPWFYKVGSLGLPQIDLFYNPYAEIRLKQVSSITDSEIEIFFTTTNNPGMSGQMRVTIPASKIPHDGEFHVYRYQMSQNSFWEGVLDGFRVDPYTVVTTERFEIDYVRVGDLIPEPALFLGIVLAGIAIFRKRL